MAQRPTKGFVLYNSTNKEITVNAYVNNKANAVEFKTIPSTYSKAITFNPESLEERIVFEISDSKTNKKLGIAVTSDDFEFTPNGSAYILELKVVNNSYVINIKDLGFNKINFYNNAPVVAKFELYELPAKVKLESKNLGKLYWSSPSKIIKQSESIELDSIGIADLTLLAIKASVSLGSNSLANIPILYSKSSGKVAGFKLTGNFISNKLEVYN